MPTVRQVIRKCGDGAKVEIWISSWGGPSHFGTWIVDKKHRTLLSDELGNRLSRGETWGEIGKEYARDNRLPPPRIAKYKCKAG